MIYFQSRINDFFRAEENRLTRLEVFCDAHLLNFYAAKEEIAEVFNNTAFSMEEVQERFFAAVNFNLRGKIELSNPWFWDLLHHEKDKISCTHQ